MKTEKSSGEQSFENIDGKHCEGCSCTTRLTCNWLYCGCEACLCGTDE